MIFLLVLGAAIGFLVEQTATGALTGAAVALVGWVALALVIATVAFVGGVAKGWRR